MGLSCCSPDSWCKRFNVVNASLKSERSLTGPVFPELLREIHQFCLYRKYSACVMQWEKSLSARSSILIQTSSLRSCSSWDARNSGSFKKRSWISLKRLLMHLFFKLWAIWYYLFSGAFPYLWPWGRILCTASWGLSRIIQTALRCPCPASFSWTSYWTGCRLCFVVDLVEEIVGEGHERNVFGMLFARDLCHGKQRVSPFCYVSQLFHEKKRVLISWERDASFSWLMSRQTTRFSVLSWSGFGFGLLDWELFRLWHNSSLWLSSNLRTQFLVHSCVNEIFDGGRGDMYTFFVYNFSRFHPINFRDTTSWEWFVKNGSIRSCLIGLQSFLQSKVDVDPIHRILMFLPCFMHVLFEEIKSTLSKSCITLRDCLRLWIVWSGEQISLVLTTGLTVLWQFWVVFPRTKTIRFHKWKAGNSV